jgi:D-alanine-D-alanine ligase
VSPENERHLALIFGGVSPEHEVSIQSAANIAQALEDLHPLRKFLIDPVYINTDGEWVFHPPISGPSSLKSLIGRAPSWEMDTDQSGAVIHPFTLAIWKLNEDGVEVALIIMHGQNGEDGRLQGTLDLAQIPYTGSGAAASALAMDKPRCQAVLHAAGLPIAPSVVLNQAMLDQADRLIELHGLPLVVKPARGGSSVGITIVNEAENLHAAMEAALLIDREVMIEKYVGGREFSCGIIERDGQPTPLPVTEIIPPEGRFFDYDAKYEPGVTREVTPADISAHLSLRLQQLAHQAHRALDCRGFSRVDFIADPADPVILEINTIPGFTENSLLPQGAAAAGIRLPALATLMIDSAAHD